LMMLGKTSWLFGSAETCRQGFDEHTNILSYIFHFKAWKLMMLGKMPWLFGSKIIRLIKQLTVTTLVMLLLLVLNGQIWGIVNNRRALLSLKCSLKFHDFCKHM
jgi:hypothetical protein